MVGERVNREITNFHLLRCHATKVAKVVVCTRTCILLSLKAAQNTSKYQISAKSVIGFESYEHPKFRPMCQLKYRLLHHNDVIVVTLQVSLLPLCRIHQA